MGFLYSCKALVPGVPQQGPGGEAAATHATAMALRENGALPGPTGLHQGVECLCYLQISPKCEVPKTRMSAVSHTSCGCSDGPSELTVRWQTEAAATGAEGRAGKSPGCGSPIADRRGLAWGVWAGLRERPEIWVLRGVSVQRGSRARAPARAVVSQDHVPWVSLPVAGFQLRRRGEALRVPMATTSPDRVFFELDGTEGDSGPHTCRYRPFGAGAAWSANRLPVELARSDGEPGRAGTGDPLPRPPYSRAYAGPAQPSVGSAPGAARGRPRTRFSGPAADGPVRSPPAACASAVRPAPRR
ncbi:PREDICTED: alpha-1B-glycoprotein [Chinchilla lanigera]|uniref:alpha-1B-glycoprotein n=1 Tax=Chinchilla lanigera TaxID=34839 RepID=UPI000698B6B9|nr:PREDICTED: alpha-1B-glycoprotein [Chinchilla lanigera]